MPNGGSMFTKVLKAMLFYESSYNDRFYEDAPGLVNMAIQKFHAQHAQYTRPKLNGREATFDGTDSHNQKFTIRKHDAYLILRWHIGSNIHYAYFDQNVHPDLVNYPLPMLGKP